MKLTSPVGNNRSVLKGDELNQILYPYISLKSTGSISPKLGSSSSYTSSGIMTFSRLSRENSSSSPVLGSSG